MRLPPRAYTCVLLALPAVLVLVGCAAKRGPKAGAHGRQPEPVVLSAYVYVDADFVARFGSLEGKGRGKINDWLWETERQMQTEFPIFLTLADIGAWCLPPGALDGTAIFEKYVPAGWPPESRANCLIAITGRKGVYWSGVAEWPRIFVKAQAAEPVDEKTVGMLCHEISHWFGARDIIDPDFPERSVMNYKDARFGVVDGRVVWDRANRERIRQGIAAWRE